MTGETAAPDAEHVHGTGDEVMARLRDIVVARAALAGKNVAEGPPAAGAVVRPYSLGTRRSPEADWPFVADAYASAVDGWMTAHPDAEWCYTYAMQYDFVHNVEGVYVTAWAIGVPPVDAM